MSDNHRIDEAGIRLGRRLEMSWTCDVLFQLAAGQIADMKRRETRSVETERGREMNDRE